MPKKTKSKKETLSIEFDFDTFINYKTSTYNHKTKEHESKIIDNMQEFEECLYDGVDSPNYSFNELYDCGDMLEEAKKYLLKEYKYITSDLIDDNLDYLENNILQACENTWRETYINEWIKEAYKLVYSGIEYSLNYIFEDYKIDYNLYIANDKKKELMPDNYKDICHQGLNEYEKIKVVIYKKDAITYFEEVRGEKYNEKEHGEELADIIHDDILNNQDKPIYEYIDNYGTIGDYDDWFDYFKDSEEVSEIIETYLKMEKAKINGKSFLNTSIIAKINDIHNILKEYSTDKEYNKLIKRATGSIKATISKAI